MMSNRFLTSLFTGLLPVTEDFNMKAMMVMRGHTGKCDYGTVWMQVDYWIAAFQILKMSCAF